MQSPSLPDSVQHPHEADQNGEPDTVVSNIQPTCLHPSATMITQSNPAGPSSAATLPNVMASLQRTTPIQSMLWPPPTPPHVVAPSAEGTEGPPIQYVMIAPTPGMVYALPSGPNTSGYTYATESSNAQKSKRSQVKSACKACAAACKRCDEQRPCQRCQKYGIASSCEDQKRKERQKGIKRGPYKRRNKTTTASSTPDNLSIPPTVAGDLPNMPLPVVPLPDGIDWNAMVAAQQLVIPFPTPEGFQQYMLAQGLLPPSIPIPRADAQGDANMSMQNRMLLHGTQNTQPMFLPFTGFGPFLPGMGFPPHFIPPEVRATDINGSPPNSQDINGGQTVPQDPSPPSATLHDIGIDPAQLEAH